MIVECKECEDIGWLKTNEGMIFCYCKTEKKIVSTVGERFKDCNIETITPFKNQKEAVEKIRKEPEKSYFLIGRFGTGKTYLLSGQYCFLIRKSRDFRRYQFFRENELIKDWQDWTNGQFLVTPEFKKLDYLHLFIDDLGKGKITEKVNQELFSLIDLIYLQNWSFSVSTNWELKELVEKGYDGGTIRRMEDICEIIRL